jgi:hypothetical protein
MTHDNPAMTAGGLAPCQRNEIAPERWNFLISENAILSLSARKAAEILGFFPVTEMLEVSLVSPPAGFKCR